MLSEKGAELSHAVRKAESYEREVSVFLYDLHCLDDLDLLESAILTFLPSVAIRMSSMLLK